MKEYLTIQEIAEDPEITLNADFIKELVGGVRIREYRDAGKAYYKRSELLAVQKESADTVNELGRELQAILNDLDDDDNIAVEVSHRNGFKIAAAPAKSNMTEVMSGLRTLKIMGVVIIILLTITTLSNWLDVVVVK